MATDRRSDVDAAESDPNAVFRALADPTRRTILDLLRIRDGRSLSELHASFDTTRQAVMRHLRILEEAGLVTSRKDGRTRHHFLNAIPIQTVYDRWVDPFTKPLARGLTRLKHDLEDPMTEQASTRRLEIHIATTPEKLWNALVDPAMTEKYYFGTRLEGATEAGSAYVYQAADGPMIEGEIVEAVPHERLVMTFRPLFNLEPGDDPTSLNTSRVTYSIACQDGVCTLTLEHDEMRDPDTVDGYVSGWSRILSGLKTLLETGRPLGPQSTT